VLPTVSTFKAFPRYGLNFRVVVDTILNQIIYLCNTWFKNTANIFRTASSPAKAHFHLKQSPQVYFIEIEDEYEGVYFALTGGLTLPLS
jgi:hypothetical protein